MKVSLLNHIIENCGGCQVISAENDMPDSVDYAGVNLIRFSKTDVSARAGLLKR